MLIPRTAADVPDCYRLSEAVGRLQVEAPQTNIVFVQVAPEKAAGLVDQLKARGVLATGLYTLRFVTHLDVDAEGVDQAIHAMREILGN